MLQHEMGFRVWTFFKIWTTKQYLNFRRVDNMTNLLPGLTTHKNQFSVKQTWTDIGATSFALSDYKNICVDQILLG